MYMQYRFTLCVHGPLLFSAERGRIVLTLRLVNRV